MSKTIKLKKGLDIKLVGEAEQRVFNIPLARTYGISPSDFPGLSPKLLVQSGESVEAGSPLFFDKRRPEIVVTSPVSGTVLSINRGDKRSILNVVIEADQMQQHRKFEMPVSLNKESVTALLLASGLWPCVIQRPYGVVANPEDRPKAIFVSGFDSAPLAPDMDYILSERIGDLEKGFSVLKYLTNGKVHLGLSAQDKGFSMMELIMPASAPAWKKRQNRTLEKIKGVEKTYFSGPHPSGNVGVHINHIDPVNKGETVWTVDIQNVAIIGHLFNTGRLDMKKTYAMSGSEMERTGYVRTLVGTPIEAMTAPAGVKRQKEGDSVRYISGNVLTGTRVGSDGYIGFYSNMLTVIPEGDKYEMLGWAMPRLNKFSVSRTYFSWIQPGKEYVMDTNLHGGHRPFIVTGLFERYVPMDIYPMYLLKAILAQDIDKMENLGIYEVVEEDLALCEFVDPSKNDIQQIVRDGINLMIKELS